MDNIVELSSAERRELFSETAARMGLRPGAVEKDFWICWLLKELFSTSGIKEVIMFKGGTSLSKVFHLIDRFSEDIDLVLDWRTLGVADGDAWADRSKNQQARFNEDLNAKAREYLRGEFTPRLRRVLDGKIGGADFDLACDQEDGQMVRFLYPRSIAGEDYLRPDIQLEIGPVAAWTPCGRHQIKSYAAEQFGELFAAPLAEVSAIDAERTFWEKATILHQESHRLTESPPLRYSRHYYDLYMMSRRPVRAAALSRLDILRDVVEFKMKFYHSSWADYGSATPGTLSLVPPECLIKHYQDDYGRMRVMIFGEYPAFDDILRGLRELEGEINQS